jgi:phosphotransferase system  glucose/maltose/N-acetylglucosamine-specific IIC component
MKDNLITDLLMSLSVSFFGLLLIFGLGFVFPLIDPYASIKWIVIVCAVAFFYSFVSFLVVKIKEIVDWKKGMKKEVKKVVKAKKTSKK